MKKSTWILFILFLFHKAEATHIIGGEISYRHLGSNVYTVTLNIYRDCYSGAALFDNPASIGIFNSNGSLVQNLMVSLSGSSQIQVNVPNPCITVPVNVCVEEGIYVATVTLQPLTGGYDLVYQRCCRNYSVVNLSSPGTQGGTYAAHIPDPALAAGNSSPVFSNFPPILLCQNTPLSFDHSANDADGDSLVYELCDPLNGASAANPKPSPPFAPPYFPVTWAPPYSAAYPLNASPALSIDPSTGLLTGTPAQNGQWVVGVCVKEYRNGQLLETYSREFQFNVVSCPAFPVSSMPAQTTFCSGLTVNFLNNSVNASTYFWDFGDPSTNADTSTLATPSWTYPAPGSYTVMLIADPGSGCPDTAYTVFDVAPLLSPSFIRPSPQCVAGNSFSFSAGGVFQGNGTFLWDFGANAVPPSSAVHDPSGISFSVAGSWPVTLTISENGCSRYYTDSVVVYPLPVPAFKNLYISGCAPVNVQFYDSSATGAFPVTYAWDLGDGSTSSDINPVHLYAQPGAYTVTLTLYADSGCAGQYTYSVPGLVEVLRPAVAGFSANPLRTSILSPEVTFTDQSTGGIACMLAFGDGSASNDCSATYAYSQPGQYTAMLVVTSPDGCTDTALITIEILSEFSFWAPNAFTPNGDNLNEVFTPLASGIDQYRLSVFNRWGEMIFESEYPEMGWDGTYKGRICQEGAYVWKAGFLNLATGARERKEGYVMLMK